MMNTALHTITLSGTEPGGDRDIPHTMRQRLASLTGRSFLSFILLLGLILSGGCTRLLDRHFADTVAPLEGELSLSGLKSQATIRRDDLGIPFVEAQSMEDLAFAIGYVHAADRLNQMNGFKLLSQGRLAEMAGEPMVEIDLYMRSLNLMKAARILYREVSPENRLLLEHYCDGVNAYVERHKDALPPEFQLGGYTPETWKPIDSIGIFVLVNLSLSFNLYEEVNFLTIAQTVGPEKAAWLVPIYPDEDIPLHEAQKLVDIDLTGAVAAVEPAMRAQAKLKELGMISVAASNNWAIAKERTTGKASILANDTHLMLSLPSMWNLMHLRCGDFQAAGVTIPGLPSIVAGYNGHVAWGMTMVMADNQDTFLEQVKEIDGELHYLYQGNWIPTAKRQETISIRGKDPRTFTIHETIHGPLLNEALATRPKTLLQPGKTDLPYGLALSWAVFEPGDKTIDAYFALSHSRSAVEALAYACQVRAISLNMVMADRDHIAWQVTGRYPIRKKGRGLMPSPGWTGDYDWTGFLDVTEHPSSLDPPSGFIATANNRTVPADFPHTLSSSWYWPERSERIAELITSTGNHTAGTSMDMQRDIYSRFAFTLKQVLLKGDLSRAIEDEITSWNDPLRQEKAREAMAMLSRFDGHLSSESREAPLIGALLHQATYNTFLDELGPEGSPAWIALMILGNLNYGAISDHLAIRGDGSPFWDRAGTPGVETKARILADSFADAMDLLEKHLGRDRASWKWGDLHTYSFETEASKMARHMGFVQKTGMRFLGPFFNRGPYPAPGDHTTLNVSGYTIARDFDTWLIPAMRIIVDFSLDEPLYAINSTGASDNPASPHYDDGITQWLHGNYRTMPFRQENIEKQYTRILTLKPAQE